MLLGRLDVGTLKSVLDAVDINNIRSIFQKKIGDPLGVDAETAAAAVLRMATTRMAGATRMVSVSLGLDPRDFTLFAFGGAGPLHASALAKELGVPEVLVPARPGITNALGCVVADLRHDFVRTINMPVDDIKFDLVSKILVAQAAEGETLVREERLHIEEIEIQYSLDMQFMGQTHLLQVPLFSANMTREQIKAAFEDAYFNRFRVRLSQINAIIVNVNTIVIGRRPEMNLSGLIDKTRHARSVGEALIGSRPVWFDMGGAKSGWLETPVYSREKMPIGAHLSGPAIFEQMDSTTLIEPKDSAVFDDEGNIFISVGDHI